VKSLVAFAAVAAVAAIAAPASAQSLASFAPISYNAGVGYTGFSIPRADISAVTIRAGADFGKYFGVEGEGAFGLGDSEYAALIAVKTHLNDEYAGYAVVRYPVLPNANVFVRGGYGHSDIKVTATDVSTGIGASATGGSDSWNFGGGGQYFLDGKNGVRLEYTRYDYVTRDVKGADSFTVSYVHKF